MKFSYKFSNLIGTVYQQGTIIFSQDGNSVLCPVGNKISVYDLRNNCSHTLPVEGRYDFTSLALSPNGVILIAAEEDGNLYVINLNFRTVIYRRYMNCVIRSIKFSPDGKHFAITKNDAVLVYAAPGTNKRLYDPFTLERAFGAANDDTTCIDWSSDSRIIAAGSKDMIVRVYAFMKCQNLREYTLGSHKDTIVGVFFEEDTYDLHTVGREGMICSWQCSVDPDGLIPAKNLYKKPETKVMDEEDDLPMTQEELSAQQIKEDKPETDSIDKVKFSRCTRHFVNEHFKGKMSSLTTAQYHKKTHLMVLAFASGDFLLLDMNDNAALVHSLNVSEQYISSIAINFTGDWVALGVSSLGQLLVWEWQSETYVLKQQGHINNMSVAKYSPDGLNLVTGGEDGKVKVWSTASAFCFVTFPEHTAPITGLAFTQSGKAILSSSLDGTVRAFDLIRYRNFKTLTSHRPTQFSCVAVDAAGELVVAGGQGSHEIYLWSLQMGRLLEVLAGHTGPVVSLDFSKELGSSMLVSTAWDGTVKVWDAIANTTAKESIPLCADGLFVAFRPDGKQLAVATMDGQINMFDPVTGKQQGSITGRSDIGAGRADADKITARKNLQSKCFTTLCYSSDGQYILAGGQSKNVCIYSVEDEILIKKFEITQNRSFDAMDETINRRKLAENGLNLSLIEDREDRDSSGVAIKLPGTKHTDKSLRTHRPEVRVTSLHFSPTGRSWAASSSEGLLIYSLDDDFLFDPLDLDIANTPSAVKQKLKEMEYSTALMMALRLNINILKQEVIESIPIDTVSIVVRELGQMYVENILKFIAEILETTPHLGLYTKWAAVLVTCHGQILKTRAPQIMSIFNALQRSLITHHTNLNKVCSHNEYMLKYLIAQGSLTKRLVTKTYESIDEDMENPLSEPESEDNIEDLFGNIDAEP